MKHVTNFNQWHSANRLNEGDIATIQVAIILAILGWKGLKFLTRKLAQKIGEGIELDEAKLKSIIDDVIDYVEKEEKSGIALSEIRRALKAKVDAGEIKKIADIDSALKEYRK